MKRQLKMTAAIVFVSSLVVFSANAGEINFVLETQTPDIKTHFDGRVSIGLNEAGTSGLPGQPALPVRVVRLAIPPEAVASTVGVNVHTANEKQLDGSFDVRPLFPSTTLGGKRLNWGPNSARIVNGYDTGIYGRDDIFPASFSGRVKVDELRRYRFVIVPLNPVRYRPGDGALFHASRLEVKITFETRDVAEPVNDCVGDETAALLIDNYVQARAWYAPECPPPEEENTIAIITTEQLRQEMLVLGTYVMMRRDQGYEVVVATEIDWDVSTGEDDDTRADRIRRWLQDNYQTLGFKYVLLIGNPDPDADVPNSIPMKWCGTRDDGSGDTTVAPTDFYYADLSGDWDKNKNGVSCEFAVDDTPGSPELWVGRIPVYSDGAIAADEILWRIFNYEQDSASGDISWRRRALLPNSIYFFKNQYGDGTLPRWDGAVVGEWFIRTHFRPRGMKWTTMYEREGVSPSNFESHLPVTTEAVVDQWARGYGFVFWTGHGATDGVYRLVWNSDDNEDEIADYGEVSSPEFMSTGRLHMMTDAPPPFVVHGSCSNGKPETPDNLGYNMLRRGAIATVSASREAMTWHFPDEDPELWEKPNQINGDVIDMVTDYSENLFNGMEAGRALGYAIAKTSEAVGDNSIYQKSIQNLYGDPVVRYVMCRDDVDCDNHLECDGQEFCVNGSCMAAEVPVECEPTAQCNEMVCAEGRGCVASDECLEDEDTDSGEATDSDVETDSQTDGEQSFSSTSHDWGCAFTPRANNESLVRVLVNVFTD